jgi:hypothetical protein
MAVTKRLRYEVLRRDEFTCRYCGASAPDAKLTVDHVIPKALGGADTPDNLVAACVDCNSGKSSANADQRVVDDVAKQAFAWRLALDASWSEWREEKVNFDVWEREFDDRWTAWRTTVDEEIIPRDEDWAASVRTWLGSGFTIEELVEFIPTAMKKKGLRRGHDDRWKYYCGIVWRTLDEIQRRTTDKATNTMPRFLEHESYA